jgi:hypothetical protein
MKAIRPIALLLPILVLPLAHGQEVTNKRAQIPIEASVCKMVDHPSSVRIMESGLLSQMAPVCHG